MVYKFTGFRTRGCYTGTTEVWNSKRKTHDHLLRQREIMGLFSLFNRPKPEEVYQSIAKKIVAAALSYKQEISTPNNRVSADVGAEMIYLLLHLVDRQALNMLGVSGRDAVFDEVWKIAVGDYLRAVLDTNAPQNVVLAIAEHMMNTLNSRQSIYAQCQSLTGKPFPSRGTMVFAFSFFVHRALGHTERDDVDDILAGKRDLSYSDSDDFPGIPDVVKNAIRVGVWASELRVQDDLKQLK